MGRERLFAPHNGNRAGLLQAPAGRQRKRTPGRGDPGVLAVHGRLSRTPGPSGAMPAAGWRAPPWPRAPSRPRRN